MGHLRGREHRRAAARSRSPVGQLGEQVLRVFHQRRPSHQAARRLSILVGHRGRGEHQPGGAVIDVFAVPPVRLAAAVQMGVQRLAPGEAAALAEAAGSRLQERLAHRVQHAAGQPAQRGHMGRIIPAPLLQIRIQTVSSFPAIRLSVTIHHYTASAPSGTACIFFPVYSASTR